MNVQPNSPEETTSGATAQESRRDSVRVRVVRSQVVIGSVLAATGGAAFGHAWTVQVATWWWVGGISLLAGALVLLSAVYTRR